VAEVKKVTPIKHHALLDYIERARRKRANKAKRAKLLTILGREDEIEKKEQQQHKKAADDTDSDDEMDS
jgi:hypothetical protein